MNTKKVISFSDLDVNEGLLKALVKLELTIPTEIQSEIFRAATKDKDIVACAETGSGKTIAYLLVILQKIIEQAAPNTATRCLILVPTRELAKQIESVCQSLCQFTQITCLSLIGGLSFKEQKAKIRKNPEMIIATPGRILEHLNNRSVDLSDLEFLVLDEADRMLDMGLREDVLQINTHTAANKQSILLSATLKHKGIGAIAESVLNEALYIEDGKYRQGHNSIKHQIILADSYEHKQQLLVQLLKSEQYQKVLLFTHTRKLAEQLCSYLQYKKLPASFLHGELMQADRQKITRQFRQAKKAILVATDLAARGLDIAGLDLVINLEMARSGDDYLHRVGRTGRAGSSGTAITLVAANDWNLCQSVARYLNIGFETVVLKGLAARFNGKVSRKSKTKPESNKPKSKAKPATRAKQRLRNKKNKGKRRVPGRKSAVSSGDDGQGPLKRK